jgi:hypothetical protein
MTEQDEELNASPTHTANVDEKILIAQFMDAKSAVDQYNNALKIATEKLDHIEAQLISLLEDDGKTASARYEGLGHVCIVDGAAFASIEKGRQEEVMDFVKSIGREDMIKTSIHSSTLSTFVRECLKRNDPLPPGVTFYKPKTLRLYKDNS